MKWEWPKPSQPTSYYRRSLDVEAIRWNCCCPGAGNLLTVNIEAADRDVHRCHFTGRVTPDYEIDDVAKIIDDHYPAAACGAGPIDGRAEIIWVAD